MMEKVKVTRKYQVTIPKWIREEMGIKVGDELLVRGKNGRIIFERPGDIDLIAGSWTHIEDAESFMKDVRRLWRTWRLK